MKSSWFCLWCSLVLPAVRIQCSTVLFIAHFITCMSTLHFASICFFQRRPCEWIEFWSCHLWLIEINCWSMLVLVHSEAQQSETKCMFLNSVTAVLLALAVGLSFKSQCVNSYCGMVDGYAAHPRYSFCEVILQVGRTRSKLKRTLKQNCNTISQNTCEYWILHQWSQPRTMHHKTTKADIIALNQCQEGCVEKWGSFRP